MTTALWVLVMFAFMGAVATFVFFIGGALVAWVADMAALERRDDE